MLVPTGLMGEILFRFLECNWFQINLRKVKACFLYSKIERRVNIVIKLNEHFM